MTSINDIYGGKSMKADDIPKGKVYSLTISNIRLATFNDGERKLILHFHETDKELGLNKTNAKRTAEVMGTPEAEEWVGRKINLHNTTCDFKGDRVDCIRVMVQDELQAALAATAPPVPPAAPDGNLPVSEDDIPF